MGRAIWALRIALAGGICVWLLAGCSGAEARRHQAMAKGSEYFAAGNYEKARVEFRNALQIAPNDPDARYQNGRVLEKLQKPREALQFYQAAVDIRPDFPAARADLARLLLFAGAPDRAMEVLKPGLEAHPADAMMLTLRAASRSRLKDMAGALEDAERAVQIDPKSEEAAATLAGLYSSSGRSDKAQALLERAATDHPQSTDLRMALAQLYNSLHDSAHAEAALREIVRLQPAEPAHRIRLARFLLASGQNDAAEVVLRDGLREMPTRRELQSALVEFLAVVRGPAAAEDALKQFAAGAPADDLGPQFALAQFYVGQRMPSKAEEIYRAVIAAQRLKPDGLMARNRLAALRARQNDPAGARQLIGEVLKASPRDADALVLRGELLLEAGELAGAIADLRAVLRDQPNATGILSLLARAHLENHEAALAEEALRRAVDADPADPGARLELANLLSQTGKPEQAKALLEGLAKARPDDVSVQTALFRASIALKDEATGRAAASAIVALKPEAALGHLFLGTVEEQSGHVDAAVREYETALKLQPDAVDSIKALTELLVRSKRIPEALRRLDQIARTAPASPVPLSLKAEIFLSEKRYSEASAASREALDRAPTWWIPYHTLAVVALAQGDRKSAVATLTSAIDKVREPDRIRAELAQIYSASGQADEAIREYEQILKAEPRSEPAANNLAMLLAGRSDSAAIARAAELVRNFGSSANPAYLDTYGWVKLKQGDVKAALPALEKAQAAAPGGAELRYHLAMAQLAAGQKNQAADNLRQALAVGSRFDGSDDAKSALARLASAQ